MARKANRKQRLNEILQRESPAVVDERLRDRLADELAPVSPKTLRSLLREAGVRLAPVVEGVRQQDFDELEHTLLALAVEYSQGDRARRRVCRALVIEAKDHARLTARNPKVDSAKRGQKEEMVLWMLTWLENPLVFETWIPMRKRALIGERPNPRE